MLNHGQTSSVDAELDHPPMCGREIATNAPCPDHPRTGTSYGTGYADGQRAILKAVSALLPSPAPVAESLTRCQVCQAHLEISQPVRQSGHDAYGNVLWAHEPECPPTAAQVAHQARIAQAVSLIRKTRDKVPTEGTDTYSQFLGAKYPNLVKESTE